VIDRYGKDYHADDSDDGGSGGNGGDYLKYLTRLTFKKCLSLYCNK